jgi:hypothetical protein
MVFSTKRDGITCNPGYMPRNHKMEAWLQQLRDYLGDAADWQQHSVLGPRFLHSTGSFIRRPIMDCSFRHTDKEVDLDTRFRLTFGALQKARRWETCKLC